MKLGCDPEVFLMNNKGLLPVFGLVGGTKDRPRPVEGMAEGFTFQEDNVALEFGIPPAETKEIFCSHVKAVQEAFLKNNPKLTFSKLSCAIFPKNILDYPQAHMFGCEPDMNAWTGKENVKPNSRNPCLRAAGGHIHVSLPEDPKALTEEHNQKGFIQALDFYLAIPSLLMDKDIARRKLYGKAGAYRVKPYGVEYRTLSNFWIFEEKYINWVWDNTARALKSLYDGEDFSAASTDIQRIINTGDVEDAKILIQAYDLEVVA